MAFKLIYFLAARDMGAAVIIGLFSFIILWLMQSVISRKSRKREKMKSDANSSIKELEYLKNKGIISDKEYSSKVQMARSSEINHILKNLPEYQNLQSLKKKNILDNDEFEAKVAMLRKSIGNKSYDSDSFAVKRKHYNPVKKQRIVGNGFKFFTGTYDKFEVILENGDRAYYYKKIWDTLHFVHVNGVRQDFPDRENCFAFIATHYVDH